MQGETGKKGLKIALTVLASIILLLLCIKVGERLVYASFYSRAEKEFGIPGLNDNFVPQGMAYIPNENPEKKGIFLMTGFMSDGSASRVYALDYETREVVAWAEMKKADGTDDTGHTGGIACVGAYVYVTADDGLNVFLLEDLMSGSGQMVKQGEIDTHCVTATCNVYGDYMLVGTYYRAGSYETPEWQHIKTPAGDKNTSVAMVFRLDAGQPWGVDSMPVAVLSMPSRVQGLCVDGQSGDIVLSTSWGFDHSYIYVYEKEKLDCESIDISLADGATVNVPLYYLDRASLKETIVAPPMSEEIVELNGRLYIFNESASNKYVFGKLFSAYDLYSYELNH